MPCLNFIMELKMKLVVLQWSSKQQYAQKTGYGKLREGNFDERDFFNSLVTICNKKTANGRLNISIIGSKLGKD